MVNQEPKETQDQVIVKKKVPKIVTADINILTTKSNNNYNISDIGKRIKSFYPKAVVVNVQSAELPLNFPVVFPIVQFKDFWLNTEEEFNTLESLANTAMIIATTMGLGDSSAEDIAISFRRSDDTRKICQAHLASMKRLSDYIRAEPNPPVYIRPDLANLSNNDKFTRIVKRDESFEKLSLFDTYFEANKTHKSQDQLDQIRKFKSHDDEVRDAELKDMYEVMTGERVEMSGPITVDKPEEYVMSARDMLSYQRDDGPITGGQTGSETEMLFNSFFTKK